MGLLQSPLAAAARLLGRERAAVRGRVLDALAGTRARPVETTLHAGSAEVELCLPAGAGPHPVVVVVAEGGAAFARRLAALGVAAVAVPLTCPAGALLELATLLGGRIDINPHEIGLAVPADAPVDRAVPAAPGFAFVERGPEAGLEDAILSRVTRA